MADPNPNTVAYGCTTLGTSRTALGTGTVPLTLIRSARRSLEKRQSVTAFLSRGRPAVAVTTAPGFLREPRDF